MFYNMFIHTTIKKEKNNMKKASIILSTIMAIAGFAACGSTPAVVSDTSASSETKVNETEAETTAETTAETNAETNAETSSSEESYFEWASKTIAESEYAETAVEPYGTFEYKSYYSNTAERETGVNILLPPDYSEDKEYPVLYILHGFWDTEEWMARDIVGIPRMLTELYSEGKAEEMIVVLPYIFTSKEMPRCTGMDLENSLAYDNFINDLTTDLMPFIEENYSVKKGRENTAITGFSMGGRESLFIGFTRPDLFSYVGAVCPAPGLVEIPGSPMHPGQIEESELSVTEGSEPRLVYITYSDSDGVVADSPASYCKLLEDNGVEHTVKVLHGTGHDHTSVKPHLYDLFQVIFK